MKTWSIWLLPVLFLGGLMLGRWNPPPPPDPAMVRRGSDRSALDAPRPSAALAPVTGMLRIPDRVTPDPGSEADAAADSLSPDEAQDPETPRARARRRRPDATRALDGEGLEERIQWAADAWRLRSDIARDTFLADAGLGREDATQFDVLMHAMNLRIADAVETWVEEVRLRETVTPEDGVRLMHGLTEAMVITYDEMDRTLPPVWREGAGPRFDLLTFVDPSVAMPLAGIEDRFERALRSRR